MKLSEVKDKIDKYFDNATAGEIIQRLEEVGVKFGDLNDEPKTEVDNILAFYREIYQIDMFDKESDKERYYWLSGFLRDYYSNKV